MRYTRDGFQPCFEILLVLPIACHLGSCLLTLVLGCLTLVHIVGNLETLCRVLNSAWRMGLRTLHGNI